MPQSALAANRLDRSERTFNAFNQRGTVKRLVQHANCTGIARALLDIRVRKRGDENDRHLVALRSQVTLQVEAAHTWHLHV